MVVAGAVGLAGSIMVVGTAGIRIVGRVFQVLLAIDVVCAPSGTNVFEEGVGHLSEEVELFKLIFGIPSVQNYSGLRRSEIRTTVE